MIFSMCDKKRMYVLLEIREGLGGWHVMSKDPIMWYEGPLEIRTASSYRPDKACRSRQEALGSCMMCCRHPKR